MSLPSPSTQPPSKSAPRFVVAGIANQGVIERATLQKRHDAGGNSEDDKEENCEPDHDASTASHDDRVDEREDQRKD